MKKYSIVLLLLLIKTLLPESQADFMKLPEIHNLDLSSSRFEVVYENEEDLIIV